VYGYLYKVSLERSSEKKVYFETKVQSERRSRHERNRNKVPYKRSSRPKTFENISPARNLASAFDSKPPREVDCDKPHRKIIKILGRRSPKTSIMSKITAAGVRTHVDELLN